MQKTILKLLSVFVLAALALSALPSPALAAGLGDEGTPTPERGNRLLERKFQAEQKRYERQAEQLEKSPERLEKIQEVIDRAKGNGLDTSAAQAALDNLEKAMAAVAPLSQKAGSLISAHAGFDDKGKVTEAVTAAQTVEDIHLLLDQVRDDPRDEREALQHAMWDLFQEGLKVKK
jgi:TolA-binding protein